MENPYASTDLPSEPPSAVRKRRPVWKSLLIAYAVHHVLSVLGFIVGLFFLSSDIRVFPADQPWIGLVKIVLIPVSIDVYVLMEPFFLGELAPHAIVGLRWLRTGATITILIAGLAYAFRSSRVLLSYLGIVSFLIALSFAISFPSDRMSLESARYLPGPGLVPAVALPGASQHQ